MDRSRRLCLRSSGKIRVVRTTFVQGWLKPKDPNFYSSSASLPPMIPSPLSLSRLRGCKMLRSEVRTPFPVLALTQRLNDETPFLFDWFAWGN